jgi:alpha-glucosidase (family GH31 glycosyl hydrolase)
MGDWSFNEQAWPDPKAMVDECRSYGMEIMVSVWAFTCPGSRSYDMLVNNSWVTTLVGEDGKRTNLPIETHGEDCHLVDPTTEGARKYVWSLIESGYYRYGIKIFWLDASEPEGFGPLSTNASWAAGDMRDMGSMFTLYWTQAFYDGLQGHGEEDIVMLPRAGWVGTWRHGAVLWSGDIGSTMEVLKSQINIGISAQTSAIPWWTTDVGGYSGGKAEDPTYRETVGRWFQYGMTCPLLRQHGARDHTCPWFYGPETEKIIEDIIKLRASMKTYYSGELDKLNATGRPFNRPLMWDFPEDAKTWELAEEGIGDQNMTLPGGPVKQGDFVVLKKCAAAAPSQQFKMVKAAAAGKVQIQTTSGGMCLDSGGAPNHPPPTGPYPIHMWSCDKHFAEAQTWSHNAATKAIMQGSKCLTTGTAGHPALATCAPSDKTQQWTVSADGAMIESAAAGGVGGECLSVEPQTSGSSAAGVIDQYMMGDDYMAAPILNLGQRGRMVYFPKGADWTHHYTSKVYKGGSTEMVAAPLDEFPLFKKTATTVTVTTASSA